MQQFHGLASALANDQVRGEELDWLFFPMMRSTPPSGGEAHSVLCPIVQASPDLVRLDFGHGPAARTLSPVIDYGPEGMDSAAFVASCHKLAASLGVSGARWENAFDHARRVQQRFEVGCLELGRDALAFAERNGIVPVVVLGRPYTSKLGVSFWQYLADRLRDEGRIPTLSSLIEARALPP